MAAGTILIKGDEPGAVPPREVGPVAQCEFAANGPTHLDIVMADGGPERDVGQHEEHRFGWAANSAFRNVGIRALANVSTNLREEVGTALGFASAKVKALAEGTVVRRYGTAPLPAAEESGEQGSEFLHRAPPGCQ